VERRQRSRIPPRWITRPMHRPSSHTFVSAFSTANEAVMPVSRVWPSILFGSSVRWGCRWDGVEGKTRLSRPTRQTCAPQLPANSTSQVFQRVVLATLSSWDAVLRRPPTPEVAPGL
jgi:hypothetical protein